MRIEEAEAHARLSLRLCAEPQGADNIRVLFRCIGVMRKYKIDVETSAAGKRIRHAQI
jgi:hypothetical protein